MDLVTWVVHVIHMHSNGPESISSMICFKLMMNGYGGDSAYPLSTWLAPPFKKPSNQALNCEQRTFNYFLSKVTSYFFDFFFTNECRSGYGWSMYLVHSRVAFNHSGSYVFLSALKRTLIMPQTGFSAASSFTTWSFDLKNKGMCQNQHRNVLLKLQQGRKEV